MTAGSETNARTIRVEIRAPSRTSLGESFDAKETIWWIAALLRMARFPYLSIPVTSNYSFSEISQTDREPTLTPFETEGRIFGPADRVVSVLDSENQRFEFGLECILCRGIISAQCSAKMIAPTVERLRAILFAMEVVIRPRGSKESRSFRPQENPHPSVRNLLYATTRLSVVP